MEALVDPQNFAIEEPHNIAIEDSGIDEPQHFPIEEPEKFATEEPQDMEFPLRLKIKIRIDINGKKTAHFIPPKCPTLTNMRQLITKFPTKCINTFNHFTGKFEEGHKTYPYKYRKKMLPAYRKLKYLRCNQRLFI